MIAGLGLALGSALCTNVAFLFTLETLDFASSGLPTRRPPCPSASGVDSPRTVHGEIIELGGRSAPGRCDEAIRVWGHDHAGPRRQATESALGCCGAAEASRTTASGGSVTSAEAACPCHGIGSASMRLGVAALEPP